MNPTSRRSAIGGRYRDFPLIILTAGSISGSPAQRKEETMNNQAFHQSWPSALPNIGAAIAAVAMTLILCGCSSQASQAVNPIPAFTTSAAVITLSINVLDPIYGFGVKINDTSYDNFLPLQRAASYLCAHGGPDFKHLTRLLFPPGTYHIAKTVLAPTFPDYSHLRSFAVPYENCNNVEI